MFISLDAGKTLNTQLPIMLKTLLQLKEENFLSLVEQNITKQNKTSKQTNKPGTKQVRKIYC